MFAITAFLATPAVAQRFVDLTVPTTAVPPPRVTVWLPAGYDAGTRRYGVVYMNDGQNLFDPGRAYLGKVWAADKSVARLVAAGRIEPVIIVGIDNAGADRFRQYMPVEPLAAIPALRAGMEKQMGGALQADAYLRYLVDDLKPAIDRRFRTRPDRRHTAIAGSSMGGLISFYAIAMHPETFGRAACVSTHWAVMPPSDAATAPMQDAILAMWQGWVPKRNGAPAGRRIWFDHGDRTLDRWYPPFQQAVDAALIRAGWRKGTDFESQVYPGAAHEEGAWAARLDDVLGWLLR